jgi:ssDNA-binding Zn-finger/Zn-ribbon topoisomerase 1
MKNGQCPKCGSNEVYSQGAGGHRGFLTVSLFSTAGITTYICTACGYLEDYVLGPDALQQIAEKWPRVK